MQTLQHYELLLLAAPEITQNESQDIEKQIESLIKTFKGSVISFEKWGKYKLAFPVQKNEYGVYFLIRFTIEKLNAFNKELQGLLRIRFDNIVMRSLLNRLASDFSAVYKRPRSLEEAPQEEAGSILKNKRVEGLISAVDSLRNTRSKKIDASVLPKDLEDEYEEDEK